MKLTVFGIRPRGYLRFYRWRLAKHGLQELLAGSGIAVGVALVFAVLVANSSITASAEQLIRGTTGTADFQLSARTNAGFDASVAREVERLPGVEAAAPALRIRALLAGATGQEAVQLVGVTSKVADFEGSLTENFGGSGLQVPTGMALPETVAHKLGVKKEDPLRVFVDGDVGTAKVGAVLGEREIGSLSQSLVAVAYLPEVQRLSGRVGSITQVLVDAEPGRADQVRADLERLAGDRMTVGPVDTELRLLKDAAKPNNQSTQLFAAIGGAVGFLLAFSAMLLTVPERRRFIADLREQGYFRTQVLAVLAFEALALGVLASLAGLLLGDLLSRTVLEDEPGYLALGFPIGTQRAFSLEVVAVSLGGGIAAALVASALPALDVFTGKDLAASVPGRTQGGDSIPSSTVRRLLLIGMALTVVVLVAALVAPPTTIVGSMILAGVTVLLLPAAFVAVLRPLERVARRRSGLPLWAAILELKPVPIRSVALAAVAAVAVCGSVAVEGARRDLEAGLVEGLGQYLSTADLWVTAGSDGFQAETFRPRARLVDAIQRAPEVASVRSYHGQYLDVEDRRIWVIARPPQDRPLIPPSQILEGDLAQATKRVASGSGWATISNGMANADDIEVGDQFTLPSPTGNVQLRAAAITTNLGWGPGAVILDADQYQRAWATQRPVALEVHLAHGVSLAAGRHAVEQITGPQSGLRVETSPERLDYVHGIMKQGLARLTQISRLLLIAAGLAVALAMAGSIWQRRARLAEQKIQGIYDTQLWRGLLVETGLVLAIGGVTGAAVGIFGHFLAGRWLALSTGFPAPFSPFDLGAVLALGLVVLIGLAVTALPGWIAARVEPHATFQE